MIVHTREAARVFLNYCGRVAPYEYPIAGWDQRVKAWVPLKTVEQIEEYLNQFPPAPQKQAAA